MKNIYLIIALFFITANLYSQFSISTESKYLQIVNKQANTKLISDNLINAELATDSLVNSGENTALNAQFFNELSQSYFLTKNYELALFSLLRQRCLFPNKYIEQKHKILFLEAAYRCNLTDSVSQHLLIESSIKNMQKTYTSKLKLLLELSVIVQSKVLNPYIFKTGLKLRSIDNNIPIWYQHWEFLTLINLKEKKKSEALVYGKVNSPIYVQITNNKLKYKVYRKTVKHYIKTNSFRQASKILNEYRNTNLPLMLFIDAKLKQFRIYINF